MRAILRKITKEAELSAGEYDELLHYVEDLRRNSPESYYVFYHRYANLLYLNYHTLIPKYAWDMDNLINYLIDKPELLQENKVPITAFPSEAQPYLKETFNHHDITLPAYLYDFLNSTTIEELPPSRQQDIRIKYEEANPYKEIGLKYHFERLAKYRFISRIQSYRYLTRNKAAFDRFELVGPDCLGGIFTNKEKSIYYYLFLTESDSAKASTACQLLNYTFYNRIDGE